MQAGMDVAPSLVMKAIWTALAVLLAMGVAYVLMDRLQPAPDTPTEAKIDISRPLEVLPSIPEPIPEAEPPCVGEVPDAVKEPNQPVQSIEKRGDAMLFEADALLGTPFDRAITMPFD